MERPVITDAALTLPPEVIAGHLALLEDVSLSALIKDKVGSMLDSDGRRLRDVIASNTAELVRTNDGGDLTLRLLTKLARIFELGPIAFVAPRSFSDANDAIAAAAVASLRASDRAFKGATIQDAVQHSVEAMFGQVGKRFDDLSASEQSDILSEVRRFIEQLPHAEQEAIRARLGLDSLSDDYLKKVLVSGALASAFAGAVSIGGFGFYMSAASLVATIAGLAGLTLPFAFYTTMSSLVAVVANPLFFLPLVLGGGVWLFHGKDSELKRKLAVNAVVQLALAGAAAESCTDGRDARVIEEWREARTAAQGLLRTQRDVEREATNRKASLGALESARHTAEDAVSRSEDRRKQLFTQLTDACRTDAEGLAAGRWGSELCATGLSLRAALKAHEKAVEAPLGKGFIRGLTGHFKRAVGGGAAWVAVVPASEEAANAALRLELAGTLTATFPAVEIVRTLGRTEERLAVDRAARDDLNVQVKRAQSELHAYEQQVLRAKESTLAAQSIYWGLED